MENKIFIDVTQLIHWPGNLTGIPRVMNELALRYSKHKESVFITWDPLLKSYYIVDIKSTLESRGRKIVYFNNDNQPFEIKRARKLIAKVALKLKAKGVSMPERITDLATKSMARSKLEAEISSKDTLFILWGEQASDDFIEHIKELSLRRVRIIQISYDMLPLVTPQYSGHSTVSMEKYVTEVFPLCDLVLAISRSTKNDIIDWMKDRGLRTPRVEVFRLGDDFKTNKPHKPKIIDTFIQPKDTFILCVGTIEARKNHTLLYYVYKEAAYRDIKLPKLVVVGRRGWKTENITDLITSDKQTKDKFLLLESVSDDELAWLYKNTMFTIYPSFYEGWGLPVAESIGYGIPCIASNTSSIPEIAGKLIDYFSPTSTDECLEQIVRYSDSKQLKKAKSRISRYKPTTWDTTYSQVKRYIMECANE